MLSRVPVQLLDGGWTGIKADKSGCQGAGEAEWRYQFNADIPRFMLKMPEKAEGFCKFRMAPRAVPGSRLE